MRDVPEWVGKDDNTPVPARVRLRNFLKFEGMCQECGSKIVGRKWITDHRIAICNGGQNRENNLGPIHEACDREKKTPTDVAEKSRVARKRKAFLGLKKKRTITRWRKFDGTIVTKPRER
jgi:5-methylcytosine-specific restriction enzyme A